MFTNIMRSLGFVPTKFHLETMSDLLTQRANKAVEHKAITDKMSEAIRSHAGERDAAIKQLAQSSEEIATLKREIMAALDDRLIPRLWVRDDGKTLKLELTKPSMPGDTVILRQMVKNKSNDATLAEIVRDANELFAAPKLTVPGVMPPWNAATAYMTDKPT